MAKGFSSVFSHIHQMQAARSVQVFVTYNA